MLFLIPRIVNAMESIETQVMYTQHLTAQYRPDEVILAVAAQNDVVFANDAFLWLSNWVRAPWRGCGRWPSPFGNTSHKLGIGLSYSAFEVPCTLPKWSSLDIRVDGDTDPLTRDSSPPFWYLGFTAGREFRPS